MVISGGIYESIKFNIFFIYLCVVCWTILVERRSVCEKLLCCHFNKAAVIWIWVLLKLHILSLMWQFSDEQTNCHTELQTKCLVEKSPLFHIFLWNIKNRCFIMNSIASPQCGQQKSLWEFHIINAFSCWKCTICDSGIVGINANLKCSCPSW